MKKNKLIISGLFLLLICFSTLVFQFTFKTSVKGNENSEKNVKTFVVNKQIQVGNQKYNFQGNISYEYTTGMQIDDVSNENIKIMDFYADEQSILIGETKTVTFTAKILSEKIIEGQKIELYGDDEFVGYLYDNGQGIDKKENDGTFTGRFDLYSNERKHVNYYVVCDHVSSDKILINFYRHFTENDHELFDIMDKGIEKITSSYIATGDITKDTQNALKSYNEIKSFLDNQILLGNVKEYSFSEIGFWITLSNDFPYVVGVEDFLSIPNNINSNKTKINSRRLSVQRNNSPQIITLQPYYNDPDNIVNHTDILDKSANKLSSSEYGYTFSKNLDNEQVTIEELKDLNKYRIIILSSHGGYCQNATLQNDEIYTGYILALNTAINGENRDRYEAEIDSGEIIAGSKARVTERFFENSYKSGSFDNSLIYWGTCCGANTEDLANIFIRKGATTFLAYENNVSTLYLNNMCETIFDELLKSKNNELSTIGQAVGVAKSKHGKDDMDNWKSQLMKLLGKLNDKGEPAVLRVFGNPNFRLTSSFINGAYSTLKDNSNIGADTWITVWNTDRDYSNTVFKGGNGTFSCLVPSDTYKVEVSAYGYKPRIIENVQVEKSQTNYLSNSYLISMEEHKRDIGGSVKNAINGNKISNATIKLRKNHGVSSGEYVKNSNEEDIETISDDTGHYIFENLEAGYYTAEITKDGFITGYEDVYIGSSENNSEFSTTSQDLVISPSLNSDEYRIVLTWGATPSDLDSHFTGKLLNGSSFHVYYSDKTQYDGDTCVAKLDVDDTNGYGPETITIKLTSNDTYNYYVYRYSSSGTLATSEAQVRLYKGDELLATYNVPTNQEEGRYWNVFSISNGSIENINSITTSPITN